MFCVLPCGAGRRHATLRRGLAAAALLAGLAAGAPALADEGSTHVVSLLSPVIEIESDGEHYTKPVIALAPVAASVNVALDAGVSGRIKSFKVWLKFRSEASDWADFPQHANSTTFASNQRPKTFNRDVYASVPYGSHASYLASYCNLQANALRQGGMTNQQIFSQDRPVEVAVISALQYEMSGVAGSFWDGFDGSGISGWEHYQKMTVVCQRHETTLDAPTAGPVAGANLVAGTAQVNNATGACVLGLHGIISGAVPNLPVKFRYVDAGGQQSDLKTVVTDANGFADFVHSYPLSAGIKSGRIQMVGQGPVFLSNWTDFESDCVAPPQDVATVLPPKAESLAFFERDTVMHRGLVCPAQIVVVGTLKGRGKLTGGVALFAAGLPKALAQYNIENDEKFYIKGEHTLSWGPTQAQQTVKFAMNATNTSGVIVEQLEKTEHFACRKPETTGVAQSAKGGVSTGKPKPTQTQQAAAGQLALQQPFIIQAPKSLVHKGEIRLSGGAANASYSLKFLRKNGGGYAAVQSAQLPKQMTGLAASFPLKALTGGRDWRLEVCPAGAGACKTADFRLPRIGGAKTESKAPGQPKPATVFIVPGAIN